MGGEWKRVIRQLSTSICLYLAIKDEQSTHGFYDKQALFPKCEEEPRLLPPEVLYGTVKIDSCLLS